MKRILIVNESSLTRDYLQKTFMDKGFHVVTAANGTTGLAKIRNEVPDLIILDYYLTGRDVLSILQEKSRDPNSSAIPVILLTPRLPEIKQQALVKLGARKVLTKPLQLDLLLESAGQLLGRTLELDDSPCHLEVHMNDEILFIEVARGLNEQKIHLMEFKVQELIRLYRVTRPKILLMLSDVELTPENRGKLRRFLNLLLEILRGRHRWLRVLTQSADINTFLSKDPELRSILVTRDLNQAMEGLMKDNLETSTDALQKVLESPQAKDDSQNTLDLRFNRESTRNLTFPAHFQDPDAAPRIAVVDDDFIVQEMVKNTFAPSGCLMTCYDDGDFFIKDQPQDFDLIFLDLMMPGTNGFEVMEYLQSRNNTTPVIVLSALSRKETVMKAIHFGVKSYLIKPIKPQEILDKTWEILGAALD